MSLPLPRIVSLLPAATEIAWALGRGDCLVGRSHECDWPLGVEALPPLTQPRIDPAASSHDIHEAVGRAVTQSPGTSNAIFALDIEALSSLGPDVILSQATCDVCAISGDDVAEAVRRAGGTTRVVPLGATSLAGLWHDILTVGQATGTVAKARELVARLQARCDSVACRVKTIVRATQAPRPRVVVIEWLDPPMAAGNWVPELVKLAGGDDRFGHAGHHSHWIDWPAVAAADPDVVILSPCGFTLERIVTEAATDAVWQHLATLRATRGDAASHARRSSLGDGRTPSAEPPRPAACGFARSARGNFPPGSFPVRGHHRVRPPDHQAIARGPPVSRGRFCVLFQV